MGVAGHHSKYYIHVFSCQGSSHHIEDTEKIHDICMYDRQIVKVNIREIIFYYREKLTPFDI